MALIYRPEAENFMGSCRNHSTVAPKADGLKTSTAAEASVVIDPQEIDDAAKFKRKSGQKKLIDVYVGPGGFGGAAYEFFDASGKLIESLEIDVRKTYQFSRLGGSLSHPFFISDRGYTKKSSKGVRIKGDGKFDDGIAGDESFTLSFSKKRRKDFLDSSKLYFYCTSHPSMLDEFVFKNIQPKARFSAIEIADSQFSEVSDPLVTDEFRTDLIGQNIDFTSAFFSEIGAGSITL